MDKKKRNITDKKKREGRKLDTELTDSRRFKLREKETLMCYPIFQSQNHFSHSFYSDKRTHT